MRGLARFLIVYAKQRGFNIFNSYSSGKYFPEEGFALYGVAHKL